MPRCFAAGLLAVTACAHPAPPPLLSPPVSTSTSVRRSNRGAELLDREAVVRRARAILRGAQPQVAGFTFPKDPVGCARAAFWEAGIELLDPKVAADQTAGAMEVLFRSAAVQQWLHQETPRAGDLVFFDPNQRGTALYPAQVAVVETVAADGTVRVIGCFAGGPTRVTLNLRDPSSQEKNDLLQGTEAATTAQLFRSFANPFGR